MARMSVMLALLCSLSCAHAFQAVAPLPGLRTRGAHCTAAQLRMASLGPAPDGTKVVVFGGNGFVGSRVAQQLVQSGAKVVSISRSGTLPAWADGQPWVSGVTWKKGDPTKEEFAGDLAGSAAVVSCIGVIGGSGESMEQGNGAVNVQAIQQAAAAGVPKMVYVSVSEAVGGAVGDFELRGKYGFSLKGYFKGKQQAEEALQRCFPDAAVVLAPTFIYGGAEFGLTPPRVAQGYGSLVEKALSLPPIKSLAEGLLPGVLGLALLPPVSVDSLATAAAAAALGKVASGRLDGTESINAAAAGACK